MVKISSQKLSGKIFQLKKFGGVWKKGEGIEWPFYQVALTMSPVKSKYVLPG